MLWLFGSVLLIFLSSLLFAFSIMSVFSSRSVLDEQLKPFEEAFANSHGLKRKKRQKDKIVLNKALKLTSSLVEKKDFASILQSILEQANIPLKLSEFVFFHTAGTIILSLLCYTLTMNFILTVACILFLTALPLVVMEIQKNRRKTLFHTQLPDTLLLTAGALKAGYSFSQAISMVSEETKPPIATEFKRVLAEARLGLPMEEALQNMAERVKSINFDWTVMAVKIQREVGGNLAEILEILANTIRERDRVERQIDVLTAEGKLSAMILFCLPFVLGFIIFLLNPSYVKTLFSHIIGIAMVSASLTLMIVGGIWLKKTITIEV
jgi:tight adherence protein B